MSKIPDIVSRAMGSITADNKWGGLNDKLEDMLPPDDWRLRVILNYRDSMKFGDYRKEDELFGEIKKEVDKFSFPDDVRKALFLHAMGMNGHAISALLGKNKDWFWAHCHKLVEGVPNYSTRDLQEVLQRMRLHEKEVGIDGK